MQAITTIGLDIAKSVFQIHGVDAAGNVNCSAPAQAQIRFAIFSEAAAVPRRHRGVRLVAPLVARAAGTRPYRAPDATSLCEALRQATQERCR